MPFQVHGKMRLAPRVRNEISTNQKEFLEKILSSEIEELDENKLYLKQLKRSDYVPKFSTKTWPDDEKDENDIIVVGKFTFKNNYIKNGTKNGYLLSTFFKNYLKMNWRVLVKISRKMKLI